MSRPVRERTRSHQFELRYLYGPKAWHAYLIEEMVCAGELLFWVCLGTFGFVFILVFAFETARSFDQPYKPPPRPFGSYGTADEGTIPVLFRCCGASDGWNTVIVEKASR
jgi:hypothetical protein